MKYIPVEGVNSGNLETSFDVPKRSREIKKRIDNNRNGIYCQCMAWMVSYPGITRTVITYV